MDALILAAGLGTRLGNLTKKNPKCLMLVHNKPILGFWIDAFIVNQFNNIYVNTHYLNEKVESFVKAKYGHRVTLLHEEKLLGTAGTIITLSCKINDDLLVVHADNYFTEDVVRLMIDGHLNRPKDKEISMLIFKFKGHPKNFGVVDINNNGNLINLYEKCLVSTNLKYANGACYLLSNEIIKTISTQQRNAKEFTSEVLPFYIDKIYTIKTEKTYIDIGTKKNYQLANS